MTRSTLPARRFAETFEVRHDNQTWTVTIGRYDGGAVGEVFASSSKAGSMSDSIARDGAILLSLAIQHGVPLDTIRGAITRNEDGSPSTIVGAIVDQLTGAA